MVKGRTLGFIALGFLLSLIFLALIGYGLPIFTEYSFALVWAHEYENILDDQDDIKKEPEVIRSCHVAAVLTPGVGKEYFIFIREDNHLDSGIKYRHTEVETMYHGAEGTNFSHGVQTLEDKDGHELSRSDLADYLEANGSCPGLKLIDENPILRTWHYLRGNEYPDEVGHFLTDVD